jgi:hypothetical protein
MEINKTIKPDFKNFLQLPEQTLKYIAKKDMGRDKFKWRVVSRGDRTPVQDREKRCAGDFR